MSDAETAYTAAQKLIETAREESATAISFNNEDCRALTRIPPGIADLTTLTSVNLSNTSIADLTPLSPLTGLQGLSLNGTGVTDLAPLSPLTGLQGLSLNGTGTTDLAPLSPLTSLQDLFLARTGVTDLTPLSPLTGLKSLHLDQTGVTDLAPLSPLTGLQSLWLDQTGATDLAPLSPLSGLQDLFLAQTGVTDLTPLSPLTGLQNLFLHGTDVTDLAPLRPLIGLQRLSLAQTGVTDLAPLSPLIWIKDLDLDETGVTDLRPLRDLDKFGTDGIPGLTFHNTPATARDAELARLAGIDDPKDRADQTRAYLHTLPPWPEPLPQKGLDSGTRARSEVRTAHAHIAFLLEHAAASQISAQTIASQIRHALRDVPATDGNKLPPVLQTMLDVAQVLDRLATAPIGSDNPEREAELTARIAELETTVQTLTAQLADAEAAREAAEALSAAAGFWPSLRVAAGTSIGEQAGRLIHTGILSGTVYFLGSNHTFVQGLLRAIEALK